MIKLFQSSSFWRKVKTLFFFVGLFLFVYLIHKLGPAEILSHLKKIGFKSFYIVELSFLMTVLGVWAWKVILKVPTARAGFWRLLKVKLIGETINTLTPLGWGTGDPARILLLKKKLSVTESTASVIVDRTLQNLATALFMLIGVFLFFKKFDLPFSLKIGFPISLSIILGACIFLYHRSHKGLLTFFVDLLRKLKIKKNFSANTLHHIVEIDHYISEFYKKEKGYFLLSLGLQFFCRVLGVVEIFLIAYLIGHPVGMLECYLLASVTVIINMIFVFVPGSLGLLEGAFAGVFALFHQDPTIGSSIQIIRRSRLLFWNFIGLILAIEFKKKALHREEISPQAS